MKPILIVVVIDMAAFPFAMANAQSGWYWQNPLPQGYTLYGVFFTDANTGTAVGEYGTIIRTSNGGASRAEQHRSSGRSPFLMHLS